MNINLILLQARLADTNTAQGIVSIIRLLVGCNLRDTSCATKINIDAS